jgi:hypothetical protein
MNLGTKVNLIATIKTVRRLRPTHRASLSRSSSSGGSSNSSGVDEEQERIRKLRALYGGAGFTATGGKPVGKPVVAVPPVVAAAGDADDQASNNDGAKDDDDDDDADGGRGDGDGGTAEQIWLESGYVEYMEHQRKEGWKT